MIQEVIQKLVETENEARTLVEAARAESERLMAEARAQAAALTAQAQQQARREAERLLATTLAEAEREKQERLLAAAQTLQAEPGLDPADRARVVHAVVRCVCGGR